MYEKCTFPLCEWNYQICVISIKYGCIVIISVHEIHARFAQLTKSKNDPNAKQNTSGPAKSVSCKMVWSVVLNGFNTDNVCNE